MEQNPELSLAWQFIENTGTHLFLTGKAGTGKTTFLRQLKSGSPKIILSLNTFVHDLKIYNYGDKSSMDNGRFQRNLCPI